MFPDPSSGPTPRILPPALHGLMIPIDLHNWDEPEGRVWDLESLGPMTPIDLHDWEGPEGRVGDLGPPDPMVPFDPYDWDGPERPE